MKCENPDCNGQEMEVVFTRDDGMKYWICPLCEQGVGEITDAEFKAIMENEEYEREISERFNSQREKEEK
jgi:hypothetical protein